MKSIKIFLLCAFVGIFSGQTANAQVAYNFNGSNDTIKTVTTKYLTLTAASPGNFNFEFAYERISDTVTAVATLENSIGGVDFSPVPGMDTVQINSATRVKQWKIEPADKAYYLPKYWRIKIVSSKANGQGKVRAKLYK